MIKARGSFKAPVLKGRSLKNLMIFVFIYAKIGQFIEEDL
jgi:hypothetical protein